MLPANRPDHEVGWPRAVQTGVAVLGACAFGAVALSYGYGFGGGGGRAETYPQSVVAGVSQQPTQPIVDVIQFATTGDSLRILGTAYDAGGDVHDSTHIQVDTAGGGFSSPKYVDLRIGAATTDTVTGNIAALDSGATVTSRLRYKSTNGGWSEWSDTVVGRTSLNEPAGLTVIYDNPGTSIDWATEGWTINEAFGTAQGMDRVSLDSTVTSPLGEASVIRIEYPGAPTLKTALNVRVNEWSTLSGVTIGNLDTLYIRIRFNNNGTGSGGKFLYFGTSSAADGDPTFKITDAYITQETNGGMLFSQQVGRMGTGWAWKWPGNFAPLVKTGDSWRSHWHTYELLVVGETSVGAQDGYVRGWLNGLRMVIASPDSSSTLFWSDTDGTESSLNGLAWYFNTYQNADSTDASSRTIDYAELYIAGSAN